MKARKKPVEVEARQLTKENLTEVRKWCGGTFAIEDVTDEVSQEYLTIKTVEGIMAADFGDYIIKGVNGEFYPCKPDIFHKTYEILEEVSE